MTELLCLILGLMIGYYANALYRKVSQLYEYWQDKMESPPGVVRPMGTKITKGIPTIDLSSDTGPVMRPRPAAIEEERQAERAKILQDNHR